MAAIVVVFDFDRTIIDGDSDDWVIKEMGLSQLFENLFHTMPWNSLMDRMLKELHSRGRTVDDIANCLRRAYMDPRIVAAIESAHALGCDLKIVSDANRYFIETILEHHGLLGHFSEIVTNPASANEGGRLCVFPYHSLNSAPHGCAWCPSNLCKGLVIDKVQASIPRDEKKTVIYLGDGSGDYCPTLRLGEGDYVMPRKNYTLWKRINDNSALVKAKVHEWSDGEELETVLLKIIRSVLAVEDVNGGGGEPFELKKTAVVAAAAD